jgi:hypothetical protein
VIRGDVIRNLQLEFRLKTGIVLFALCMLSACGGDSSGGHSTATAAPPTLGGPGPVTAVGIDYTPEARCSDNNWATTTPVACNPQLSFSCPSGNPLSLCPTTCQACYVSDLTNLQSSLSTSEITSYQPNYYILTAADQLHIKVLQGLFNDAIPSLAAASTATNCTYAVALCGSKYADAILDGACGTTTPWNPVTFCSGGAYIEPLSMPTGSSGQFIAPFMRACGTRERLTITRRQADGTAGSNRVLSTSAGHSAHARFAFLAIAPIIHR